MNMAAFRMRYSKDYESLRQAAFSSNFSSPVLTLKSSWNHHRAILAFAHAGGEGGEELGGGVA